MSRLSSYITGFTGTLCFLFLLSSCSKSVITPDSTKHLQEFHLVNFEPNEKSLQANKLNLFVDYSTCNMLGQNSQFFQEIAASLVDKTSAYYSIKGSEIR